MGFLSGKRILVTGVLTSGSIAFGIARACRREGAELAFTYQTDRLARRVERLAASLGDVPCHACDVASDAGIDAMFERLAAHWPAFDGLVHAIAYAPSQGLGGNAVDRLSREAFRVAHDISSYSFGALARAALPFMRDRQGALLTLSFIGARRVMPGYDLMGVAKASLEAQVRYLAAALGDAGLRVNGLSAGPIPTVAAHGLATIDTLLAQARRDAPMRRNVDIDEVGNAAAFLLSPLASGINGQIVNVDAGASIR